MQLAPLSIMAPDVTPQTAPRQNVAHQDPQAATAEKFEAMLLGQVVNAMLDSTNIEQAPGGFGEETFRSFLGNAVGQQLAKSGGIGLSSAIAAELNLYGK